MEINTFINAHSGDKTCLEQAKQGEMDTSALENSF